MTKKPLPVDALVGRNIRICRLQRGLTQTELGDHLGVTFQQIQKYENGMNRVGASRLDQIAGALGVGLSTLFDGSKNADREGPDLSGRALLAHPHALRLVQAFDMIPDKKRLAVLRLIESVGNRHPRRGSNGHPRRGSSGHARRDLSGRARRKVH